MADSENDREADRPLVSVIIRTTGRPELAEALQSVARQQYRPLEIILVDASGSGSVDIPSDCADLPVRTVSTGSPLSRPVAANQGLHACRGKYLLFLDEDDWLAPEHISNLITLLEKSTNCRAAYSSTQKTDKSGHLLNFCYRIPFDPARLMQDNYLPIHSVVFARSLLDEGCRFDESLDNFEDWDFWLQVAQITDFSHLDEVTAFYREGGESDTAVVSTAQRYVPGNPTSRGREILYDKWLKIWSGRDLNALLKSLDQRDLVDSLDSRLRDIGQILARKDRDLHNSNEELHRLNSRIADLASRLQQERMTSARQIGRLESALGEITGSSSWKLTSPLRFVQSIIYNKLVAPTVHQAKKQLVTATEKYPRFGKLLLSIRYHSKSGKDSDHLEGHLSCSLDVYPQLCHEALSLEGWALSQGSSVRLTLYIDGVEYRTFQPSFARDDIAEVFPDLAPEYHTGFAKRISLKRLPSGLHQFCLRIETASGQRRDFVRVFYLFHGNELYNAWLNEIRRVERQLAANTITPEQTDKKVHLLIDSGNASEALKNSLHAVFNQSFHNWQLHLIGLDEPELQNLLNDTDMNILKGRIDFHVDSTSALEAIRSLQGYFLCLEAGELLDQHALEELVSLSSETGADLVYSDHDEVSVSEEHANPYFTPEWSPELLYSNNYVGNVFFARIELLSGLPEMQIPMQWRYWLLLSITESEKNIRRIPRMLWSRTIDTDKTATVKEEEIRTLQTFLGKHGPGASVRCNDTGRIVVWPLETSPLVSIIIPTMGKIELLKPCIESLFAKTEYQNFELILLDNSRGANPEGIAYLHEKGLTVLEHNEPFNWSKLNNAGVRIARGELLLFLNDDMEIIEGNWMGELVRLAIRPGIGAVGSRLFYGNGAIQHAGIILTDHGCGGAHLFHKMTPGPDIYQRLDMVTREVTANTGACLMVKKTRFEEVGGFDESLAVVGNDLDFCLRLREKGYRNLWTPASTLIHHESISRKTHVPKEDEALLWQKWEQVFRQGDPYLNPNLMTDHADCSLNIGSVEQPLLDRFIPDRSMPDSFDPIPVGPAQLPVLSGVNLIGYVRAEMGLGEGARSDARALTAAGVDFGIINFETGNPGRMTDLTWQYKEIDSSLYSVNLIHVNADHMDLVIDEFPNYFFKKRYNIGYWAWELPELPESWLNAFQYLDEIWVPSDFVKKAVEAKSPVPVIKIPHCIETPLPQHLTRKDLGLPENAFLFLAMYDTRSIVTRKNPMAAIEAFKLAFDDSDTSAYLILRINNSEYGDQRKIQEAIESHPNIIAIDEPIGRPIINALLELTDCLVSLHRSEGFGLVPAEAMSLGKVTILTNWSGSTEYMSRENCMPIDYELVEIKEDYGPYPAGQVWAEPDIEQAADAMRQVSENPELAKTLGDNARSTIEKAFSPLVIGNLMKERLEHIARIQRLKD